MDDASRGGFPPEMMRAAHPGEVGRLEGMATGLVDSVETYVRERPVSAVLWALGIGFVLGWRLKPW